MRVFRVFDALFGSLTHFVPINISLCFYALVRTSQGHFQILTLGARNGRARCKTVFAVWTPRPECARQLAIPP